MSQAVSQAVSQVKDIERMAENFMFHCRFEKNLSGHTLKAYGVDLRQFIDYLAGVGSGVSDLREVDRQMLRDYLKHLSQNNKVKTVKRKIATLKALFTFLEFEEILELSPFRRLRFKIKEPLVLPGVLTLAEVKGIFEVAYGFRGRFRGCGGHRYRSVVRDIVVLELLFATGVRVSELCNLRKSDINFHQFVVRVNGKGRRERMVQVCGDETIAILREYVGLFHPDIESGEEYFLINRLGRRLSEQSVRFMVKRYAKLAVIGKDVTPHMFRHTFATLLLEQEVDIRYIQQLLGHSTITTTQIYTHVSKQKQQEILSRRHPRIHFSVT